MNYNSSRLTEECPLTKDQNYKYRLGSYCGDGLKFITSCFAILTIAITTTLILQLLYADNTPHNHAGIHGAVAADYTNCSQIGTKILWKGGNAIDAAIAATICMTVVAPHKTGLGGGGYIMIYNHKEQLKPIIVDFANNTIEGIFAKHGVRLPAVLRGLEFTQKLKGSLPWKEIVEPSVILAKEGFVVSKEFASEIAKNPENEILYGHFNAGDTLQLQDLSDTLDAIAQYGTDVLYNGSLSHKLLHDETNALEQLTQLANYVPEVYRADKSTFYKYTVYYPPHVSSIEPLITALRSQNFSSENASTVQTQILVAQTIINSIIPEHLATQDLDEGRYTGVVAMDWEDTYVCILTGLSAPLGLGYKTSAGFLLDKIDDYSNFPTFIPIIFYNEKVLCGLRGAFGTDDVLVAGQLLYNIIVRGLNVSAAIEYPRYYLLSDGIAIENDQKHTLDSLIRSQLNSTISLSRTDANFVLKSVNAIIKRKDLMASHSDSRGGGLASRF